MSYPSHDVDWEQHPLTHRIKFCLDEVARSRGVVNKKGPHKGKVSLHALMVNTGLSYSTAWMQLRTPDKMAGITWETLLRLCEFLKCEPGDLIRLESAVQLPATPLSDQTKQAQAPSPTFVADSAEEGPEPIPGALVKW